MRLYHPAFGHQIGVSGVEVSDDPDTQVVQVIGMMRDYAREDSETAELASDVRRFDTGDPIRDTFRSVKSRLRFVQDDKTAAPFSSFMSGPIVETLIRPIDMRVMLDPQGDCDDFAMTTAALLRAQGIPCGFCTVAVDPEQPWRFSHVYVVAYPNGERIPMDTSHMPGPGWECPNPFGKRQEWPLDGGDFDLALLVGLGIVGAGLWWGLKQ